MTLIGNCMLRCLAISIAIISFTVAVSAQDWVARHAMSQTQFQTVFNDLNGKGYRLKCVSGYVSGGIDQYAALWVKAAGPAWVAHSSMTDAEFQQQFNDLSKQGYRLTWVSAHELDGVARYEAIWEQKSGPAWEAKANLSATEYQQAFDSYTKQGYRPLHIWAYTVGGSPRFAVIFEKSNGLAWAARHNLNTDQYQQAFNQFTAQGYRVKVVSGYNVAGADYYAVIFEKSASSFEWARHGIVELSYQNVFDNMYYQGYRPVFLSAFTSGGAAKMNGVWENTNFTGAELQSINSQMKTYMDANGVPGAALAITKDGRLVYAAAFGYANKETGEEAGPKNLFRIASVSKPFTSVAVMKLIESSNGKFRLTDKVFGPGGILGADFPTPAGNPKIDQITVKYLLEHVSGLSNAGGDPMFMNVNMNHKQLINWVLNDPAHKMTRNTNTQFEYLNFGYCLLARVIEKVSGKPYAQFVKDNVLTTSGITDMSIGANSEAARKPREVKYYPANAYNLNVTRFDAHGGWIATPIDLVRFVVHVDGLATKPDIITASSRTTMLTDSGIKDVNGNDPNYGFGWGTQNQWHNGAMDGTIAFLQVLPNGYTYAVIANTRPANDGFAFNMAGVVQNIINGVSKWPAYDLF